MKTRAVLLTIVLGAAMLPAQDRLTSKAPLTPAQLAMQRAQAVIDKNSKDYEAYNALALALARRARETSDPALYTRGEQALQASFAISPGNYDGKRIEIWLLLGKHEFAAALKAAKPLNQRMPDDVMVWGFLTDANVELGNYAAAEDAANWMLKLRPGNLPALTRAAYLRELFGDVEGAEDLMKMALDSTPPGEVEDRAWITTQLAHLKLATGKTQAAEELLQQALAMFPGYHYALGNLAKVRIQQHRYDDAVSLLQQRYSAGPHAENLYDLASALELAGRNREAAKAFSEFERKSVAESMQADNSNHELILYYADHAKDPAQALAVAQREYSRRQDVFTIDCYAWALHVNGKDAEAKQVLDVALSVGIQDARLFRHAGVIAEANGDVAKARAYSRQALEVEGFTTTVAASK